MFKRARWLTVGFGLGVGTTVAAAHQVRKRVTRYQPGAMANRLVDSMSTVREHVTAAVAEGRAAARQRESELRGRPRRA
jgi:hypothetical protein